MKRKRERDSLAVERAQEFLPTWQCPRCEAINGLNRYQCHACSAFVSDEQWDEAVREFNGTEDELAEAEEAQNQATAKLRSRRGNRAGAGRQRSWKGGWHGQLGVASRSGGDASWAKGWGRGIPQSSI